VLNPPRPPDAPAACPIIVLSSPSFNDVPPLAYPKNVFPIPVVMCEPADPPIRVLKEPTLNLAPA